MKAFITGCAGQRLTADERAFFADERPWGFILFKRNIDTPEQVKDLVASLREAVGWNAPVLIDQEGGRVQRLGPPHWRAYPSGRDYGALYAADRETGLAATMLGARLIAADLYELGIDVDCLPVLDVPVPGAHDVIGTRAYGLEPKVVTALGRAAAIGLLEGGVLPVIKHIPGHGRAGVDSHEHLPIVDASRDDLFAQDLPPFQALAELPLAMTAHVVFTALDPHHPATTSPAVIGEIIREHIGFKGCLMSDDLSMKALGGAMADRVTASLDAGCDLVLHCNGNFSEMRAVADSCRPLIGTAARRAEAALALRRVPEEIDRSDLEARLEAMFADLGLAA
jgi:beta-N-acetylhexosaminidase